MVVHSLTFAVAACLSLGTFSAAADLSQEEARLSPPEDPTDRYVRLPAAPSTTASQVPVAYDRRTTQPATAPYNWNFEAAEAAATTTKIALPVHYNGTTLEPVGACLDANTTGVRFRNGVDAYCEDLLNYCDHPTLGHRVKRACAKTCGRCDLSTMSSIMTKCVDQEPDQHPVITVGGVAANCSYLEYFCRGFNGSEYVLRKCPRTCLFCNPEPEVITTTRWQFSTSFVDTVASGMGCSRRRRFGFCYSRRRRMS